MVALAYDFRKQLTGQTRVEIPRIPGDSPAARLSRRTGEGSSHKSIIVYDDGTVVEGQDFDTGDISASNVHTFIRGGTDFRCEASGWLHDTLIAAGYGCQYAGDTDDPAATTPPEADYPTEEP